MRHVLTCLDGAIGALELDTRPDAAAFGEALSHRTTSGGPRASLAAGHCAAAGAASAAAATSRRERRLVEAPSLPGTIAVGAIDFPGSALRAMWRGCHLHTLSLAGTSFDSVPESPPAFAATLRTLSIAQSSSLSSVKMLPRFAHVRSLRVHWLPSEAVAAELSRTLPNLESLRNLSLHSVQLCPLRSQRMRALWGRLERLTLSNCELAPRSFLDVRHRTPLLDVLDFATALRALSLDAMSHRASKCSPEQLDGLVSELLAHSSLQAAARHGAGSAAGPQIRSLDIGLPAISSRVQLGLRRAAPGLESLGLAWGSARCDAAGLCREIGESPSLRSVSLAPARISDAELASLCADSFPSLETVRLSSRCSGPARPSFDDGIPVPYSVPTSEGLSLCLRRLRARRWRSRSLGVPGARDAAGGERTVQVLEEQWAHPSTFAGGAPTIARHATGAAGLVAVPKDRMLAPWPGLGEPVVSAAGHPVPVGAPPGEYDESRSASSWRGRAADALAEGGSAPADGRACRWLPAPLRSSTTMPAGGRHKPCALGCGAMVLDGFQRDHEELCPCAEVACPIADDEGALCGWSGPREALWERHIRSCPLYKVPGLSSSPVKFGPKRCSLQMRHVSESTARGTRRLREGCRIEPPGTGEAGRAEAAACAAEGTSRNPYGGLNAVDCPWGCGSVVHCWDVADHASTCRSVRIPCLIASPLCTERVERQRMMEHLKVCAANLVCPRLKSAMGTGGPEDPIQQARFEIEALSLVTALEQATLADEHLRPWDRSEATEYPAGCRVKLPQR